MLDKLVRSAVDEYRFPVGHLLEHCAIYFNLVWNGEIEYAHVDPMFSRQVLVELVILDVDRRSLVRIAAPGDPTSIGGWRLITQGITPGRAEIGDWPFSYQSLCEGAAGAIAPRTLPADPEGNGAAAPGTV